MTLLDIGKDIDRLQETCRVTPDTVKIFYFVGNWNFKFVNKNFFFSTKFKIFDKIILNISP